MRIVVASDHAGFCQKDVICDFVRGLGHEVEDLGPETADRRVSEGTADRGILICGTGIGMAMTADKVPGVRATVVQTNKFAELCREHNDCNVICLSGRFTAPMDNCEFVKTFLTTEFGGGRHTQRVAKIMAEDERK